MLWFVWSLVHLTAMLAYGESCVTWAVSTGAGTGEIRLSLPMPRDKRRLDVEKELGTLDLAGDPQAIARWVCRYLEETYGARRDPASLLELGDAGFSLENDPGARRLWLRRIEAVLGGEASRKSLRRHAVDTLLALCVMLLMAFTFTWAFSNSGRALLLVAAASLLAYSAVWLLVFVPFFWDKVRSFLDALPLAPAALALLATLLLLRHYRAFRHLTLDVPAMRPVRNIRRPRPALSR
jgi:hypothetical protein